MFARITGLAALCVLSFVAVGCAFVEQGTDTPGRIGGTYYINGVDPGGAEYGGQLIITEVRDRTYELDWIITGSIQRGTGTFRAGVLEADWETVEGLRESRGTARYELQDDGSLIGERFEDRFDEPGYEEAFPVTLK